MFAFRVVVFVLKYTDEIQIVCNQVCISIYNVCMVRLYNDLQCCSLYRDWVALEITSYPSAHCAKLSGRSVLPPPGLAWLVVEIVPQSGSWFSLTGSSFELASEVLNDGQKCPLEKRT